MRGASFIDGRARGAGPGWIRLAAALAPVLLAPSVQASGFIAPEPPDSVVLAGPVERGPRTYRIFLSRRPHEEIVAFYAALGPFGAGPDREHGAESRVVLSYQQVLEILQSRHRDLTLADDLKVTVDWKPVRPGQAQCSGDFFHQLMAIAPLEHRQAELERLCKQYGYLDHAYFQKVADRRRPGAWIDADKEILARAQQQHGGRQARGVAANSQQVAQRMQELALSGRTAEARALAEQFKGQVSQAAGSAMDWGGWVKVLKEGEAMAYRTWVFLPTHPSTW